MRMMSDGRSWDIPRRRRSERDEGGVGGPWRGVKVAMMGLSGSVGGE